MSISRIALPSWSMVKRLPAYVKLAWALVKEPAIPWQHKAPLYGVLLYEISPPHLLIAAVPVVGQLDSIILLLLGLRHALAHCPARVAARHFSRLNLTVEQMSDDASAIRAVVGNVCFKRGGAASRNIRFMGRVVRGFTTRSIARH